jgi:hypothetical protein
LFPGIKLGHDCDALQNIEEMRNVEIPDSDHLHFLIACSDPMGQCKCGTLVDIELGPEEILFYETSRHFPRIREPRIVKFRKQFVKPLHIFPGPA